MRHWRAICSYEDLFSQCGKKNTHTNGSGNHMDMSCDQQGKELALGKEGKVLVVKSLWCPNTVYSTTREVDSVLWHLCPVIPKYTIFSLINHYFNYLILTAGQITSRNIFNFKESECAFSLSVCFVAYKFVVNISILQKGITKLLVVKTSKQWQCYDEDKTDKSCFAFSATI